MYRGTYLRERWKGISNFFCFLFGSANLIWPVSPHSCGAATVIGLSLLAQTFKLELAESSGAPSASKSRGAFAPRKSTFSMRGHATQQRDLRNNQGFSPAHGFYQVLPIQTFFRSEQKPHHPKKPTGVEPFPVER